ncbi:hypothetical protein Cgig2_007141 [Carnegiea gigantea]|uniref:Uncharacterized protein n=1 Tax=Carnegiea gigantea TaxID=171969 RepID=A0A9Q1QMM3_9CARY|nr:hypothetical protein Cgig2_007141 [Carnegiea gigantea]
MARMADVRRQKQVDEGNYAPPHATLVFNDQTKKDIGFKARMKTLKKKLILEKRSMMMALMRVNLRYDVIVNNMDVTFNAYITNARCKHLIYMLEDIRMTLMKRIVLKKAMMQNADDNIHSRLSLADQGNIEERIPMILKKSGKLTGYVRSTYHKVGDNKKGCPNKANLVKNPLAQVAQATQVEKRTKRRQRKHPVELVNKVRGREGGSNKGKGRGASTRR